MTATAAGRPASPGAELRRGPASVRVALEAGAPITSFVHEGREWCAADGWQDYAPSARACALPTFVAGAAGARFADGGSLLSDEPAVEVRADESGSAVTVSWPAVSYPVSWTRVLSFDDAGVLRIQYSARNGRRTPLPFIWGLPLTLAWESGAQIELPRGARARVAESHGEGLAAPGSEFAWPSLRDGGHLVDLSSPAALGKGRAVLCYVELPRARFSVRTGGRALEVRGEQGIVTHARVWVSNGHAGQDAPRRRWWRRTTAQPHYSVGPAIGAPDTLSEAVGSWGTARWIDPGDTVTWDVRIRVLTVEE